MVKTSTEPKRHVWTSPDGSLTLEASSLELLAEMILQARETGTISHGEADEALKGGAEEYLTAWNEFRASFSNGQVFGANGRTFAVDSSGKVSEIT